MTRIDPAEHSRAARNFAIEAARMAFNTRATNVVLLDVSRISPVTDYFIIATGTSARQMRSVCEEITELGGPSGFTPLSTSGTDGEHWMLVDFVDVVVHVFSQEARQYYDLEALWGDAVKIDWQQATAGATGGTAPADQSPSSAPTRPDHAQR
jgi:ribosome-associated protein